MSESASLFPDLPAESPEQSAFGILPAQAIRAFVASGVIGADEPVTPAQIQPASLDLRLGPTAWRVQASFLPGTGAPVERKLKELAMHEIDLSAGAVLEKGCVYIVPLMETLRLPEKIAATANPKSTTGRLDIFTRLITDYGATFEHVREGYQGRLYLEVSPRTFSILARAGDRLNQIRLRRGAPRTFDTLLHRSAEKEPLVFHPDAAPAKADIAKGLHLTIDLEGAHGENVIGFRARPHAPLVDLRRIGHYEPEAFWEPLYAPRAKHGRASLILNPDDFYILATRERVSIPPDLAAEMMPYDPAIGEFRIHYAGFFDPGFGHGLEPAGTPAVLEVRSHEVPFLMEDGQAVGRLVFESLTAPPELLYGVDIGSSYARQGLKLSKHFKPFTPRG